ncbi:MAG: hypothetical protein Q8R28_22645 [Dehalococcoidia bacterium]|nr:hypothetical protein [Dehalococcoidia bacterium]
MAETKQQRKIMHSWTANDQDWIQYDDCHRACLRLGPFAKDVEVRGKIGFLRSRVGTVVGLLPTWGPHVMVLVEWKLEKGDPKLRIPWWHPGYLELIQKG